MGSNPTPTRILFKGGHRSCVEYLSGTGQGDYVLKSVAQKTSTVIDNICFAAVNVFLEEHDFPILRDRLLMNLKGELESVQVLMDVWFRYMDGSPEKLIEVYERTNDRKESSHYENLIDLFLVSFVAELLAAIIATEISRNRDQIVKNIKKLYGKSGTIATKAFQKVSKKYESSLKYLFRVYALKAYMERMKISFADFINLRVRIKKTTNLDQENTKALPEKYSQFEEAFLKEHSLPHFTESYSEKLGDELLKLSTRINGRPHSGNREKQAHTPSSPDVLRFSITGLEKKIEGLAAYKGYASGKVIVISQITDCDKVEKGDIVVFIECRPDFVKGIRLAGALIADKGGWTSHTAIIGRELVLPTIVGTDKGTKVLNDGMHVFVDAVQGIVYEISY